MNRIIQMARKDLRLLIRDRAGAFFVFAFPILMGLFFGVMMGAPRSGGSAKMKVAIVDQDQSKTSKLFVDRLKNNDSIELSTAELDAARESVRKGSRTGMIVLDKGFGETAGVFWLPPPTIRIGVDPSRQAEAAMLQGFVMEGIGGLVGERFQDTSMLRDSITDQKQKVASDASIEPSVKLLLGTLFGTLDLLLDNIDALPDGTSANDPAQASGATDSGGDEGTGITMNFANIEQLDVTRQVDPQSISGQIRKLRSQWDISFPQAMLWGIMGCVAGFATTIAKEKSEGTMVRLQAAPISTFDILLGKATACFLGVTMVIVMMTGLGIALGMRPGNYPHLIFAAASVAFCFVGIMMTMSVLGKTEQAVGGVGWAINMAMAMVGGAMMPVMFMPKVVQSLSVLSPVKWSILALEGAIWRDFTSQEMLLPCGVLLAVGAIGVAIGTVILQKRLS